MKHLKIAITAIALMGAAMPAHADEGGFMGWAKSMIGMNKEGGATKEDWIAAANEEAKKVDWDDPKTLGKVDFKKIQPLETFTVHYDFKANGVDGPKHISGSALCDTTARKDLSCFFDVPMPKVSNMPGGAYVERRITIQLQKHLKYYHTFSTTSEYHGMDGVWADTARFTTLHLLQKGRTEPIKVKFRPFGNNGIKVVGYINLWATY